MQGEAMVFVRLSGCNLACPFCDTRHEAWVEMSEEEVVAEVLRYPSLWVLLTGGEPALQPLAGLVDRLHAVGRRVAVETNGTVAIDAAVDWVCVSPKGEWLGAEAQVVRQRVDEVKVLYDGEHEPQGYWEELGHEAQRSLQPMDVGERERNAELVAAAVEYVKGHPEWRLSMQIHKMIGIR